MVNHEGYWTGNHVLIQTEDMMDCTRVMFPQFEKLCLFDHSSGHCQKRVDCLDESVLNKGFGGGTQPMIMNCSNVFACDIGEFDNGTQTLKPGDTQQFQFPDTPDSASIGPWWYGTDEEKLRHMYDIELDEWKTQRLNKNELVEALRQQVCSELLPSRFNDDRNPAFLMALCRLCGIETTRQFNLVSPGWAGNAKGIAQILWERGKLQGSTQAHYSALKDRETGEYKDFNSLRKLLGNCRDFKEENTMLEWVGAQIGLKVVLTPKCHPELTGEGIEYIWDMKKSNYRSKPLCD